MRPFSVEEVIALADVYFEPRSNDDSKVLKGQQSKILNEHKMWTGLYKYLNGIGFSDKSVENLTEEQAAIEDVLDDLNTQARRYFINNFLRKKLQIQPDHEMMEIIMRLGYDPMNELNRMLGNNTKVTQEDVIATFNANYDAILKEARSYEKGAHLTEVKLQFK